MDFVRSRSTFADVLTVRIPHFQLLQGTLLLNGNAFTVNGSVLPAGTYPIIQQASGAITSLGSHTAKREGSDWQKRLSISVVGGNVNSVIFKLETPVFSRPTASTNITLQRYDQRNAF